MLTQFNGILSSFSSTGQKNYCLRCEDIAHAESSINRNNNNMLNETAENQEWLYSELNRFSTDIKGNILNLNSVCLYKQI